MSEEATLNDFADDRVRDSSNTGGSPNELEQEQFGPFTLSTPGEWTGKRLGDVKELITRGKQPTYDDDGVPVINQECIYWDGWRFENLRHLDEEVAEGWKSKYFPQAGDIALNSTGQGTLGRAQVYSDDERRAIDSHVTLLRTEDELNPYFHRYFLESPLGQALLYSMCVNGSTGQIELSKTRLDLFPIPIPPLEEQRKIATVLYTVDQAIQKTEKAITQFGRVKQGLYQNLFSEGYEQHNQFESSKYGRVPSSWKIAKLSEVTSQIQAGGTPDTDVAEYYGGDIAWVKTGELSQYRVTKTEQSITEKGLKESTARLFSPGTILIAMYGATTGEVSLLEIEAATNQACCGVITTDKMVSEFLFHQLKYFSDRLVSLSAGSGQQNISKGIIEKFDVLVPPVQEQKSIVSVLNNVDESIAENEIAKRQYQRLKQGLMQDLLSGIVRTHETDIEVPEAVLAQG